MVEAETYDFSVAFEASGIVSSASEWRVVQLGGIPRAECKKVNREARTLKMGGSRETEGKWALDLNLDLDLGLASWGVHPIRAEKGGGILKRTVRTWDLYRRAETKGRERSRASLRSQIVLVVNRRPHKRRKRSRGSSRWYRE
jgi:hypothetical protein